MLIKNCGPNLLADKLISSRRRSQVKMSEHRWNLRCVVGLLLAKNLCCFCSCESGAAYLITQRCGTSCWSIFFIWKLLVRGVVRRYGITHGCDCGRQAALVGETMGCETSAWIGFELVQTENFPAEGGWVCSFVGPDSV